MLIANVTCRNLWKIRCWNQTSHTLTTENQDKFSYTRLLKLFISLPVDTMDCHRDHVLRLKTLSFLAFRTGYIITEDDVKVIPVSVY